VEIKILGTGCANCEKLEQDLMSLIAETGVQADIEHVRDLKEISRYGVMGFPALVINRKVKAVGSVPPRSRIKEFIREAEAEIGNRGFSVFSWPQYVWLQGPLFFTWPASKRKIVKRICNQEQSIQ